MKTVKWGQTAWVCLKVTKSDYHLLRSLISTLYLVSLICGKIQGLKMTVCGFTRGSFAGVLVAMIPIGSQPTKPNSCKLVLYKLIF